MLTLLTAEHLKVLSQITETPFSIIRKKLQTDRAFIRNQKKSHNNILSDDDSDIEDSKKGNSSSKSFSCSSSEHMAIIKKENIKTFGYEYQKLIEAEENLNRIEELLAKTTKSYFPFFTSPIPKIIPDKNAIEKNQTVLKENEIEIDTLFQNELVSLFINLKEMIDHTKKLADDVISGYITGSGGYHIDQDNSTKQTNIQDNHKVYLACEIIQFVIHVLFDVPLVKDSDVVKERQKKLDALQKLLKNPPKPHMFANDALSNVRYGRHRFINRFGSGNFGDHDFADYSLPRLSR